MLPLEQHCCHVERLQSEPVVRPEPFQGSRHRLRVLRVGEQERDYGSTNAGAGLLHQIGEQCRRGTDPRCPVGRLA